jgi:hypothetical protein
MFYLRCRTLGQFFSFQSNHVSPVVSGSVAESDVA